MVLTSQKGRGKKIHILLDDEYVVTTDVDFWAENFIANETKISDEEWQCLLEKINYRKAFNKCADLLSRRNHSIKELKVKLLRTVDENSANKAINRFIELGYLDDRKFAFEYTNYLVNTKNFSENHVKQELFQKGINKDIIYEVLNEFEFDNSSAIINVINKSYIRKLNTENGKEKVIAALMRKGFSYNDIKFALNNLENEL